MKILDKPKYEITYTNYFKIDDKIFSFRCKELFDITNSPIWVELKDNGGSKGYWINRKWFSLSKIKELIIKKETIKDVSDLQWNIQEQLNHIFNLEQL